MEERRPGLAGWCSESQEWRKQWRWDAFKPSRLALSFSPEAKLSSADRWHASHLPHKSVCSHFWYNFQPFLEQRLSEMFSRYYDIWWVKINDVKSGWNIQTNDFLSLLTCKYRKQTSAPVILSSHNTGEQRSQIHLHFYLMLPAGSVDHYILSRMYFLKSLIFTIHPLKEKETQYSSSKHWWIIIHHLSQNKGQLLLWLPSWRSPEKNKIES